LKRRILLVLTVCLAFCLLTGGIPTKRFGMGRPFNMAPFGMVDECDANFNPTKISGCQAWYRGDLGVIPAPSNALVCSLWVDQAKATASVRDLVQPTATLCPLITAGAKNGKQGLTFSGVSTDDFLQTATWGAALLQPYTIFMICTEPTDNNQTRYLWDGAAATKHSRVFMRSGSNDWGNFAGGSARYGGTYLGGNAWRKFRLVLAAGNAADTLFIDGVAVTTTNCGSDSLGGLTIASTYNNAANTNANIVVCEFILFNKAITSLQNSADLDKLNAYFLRRYGY